MTIPESSNKKSFFIVLIIGLLGSIVLIIINSIHFKNGSDQGTGLFLGFLATIIFCLVLIKKRIPYSLTYAKRLLYGLLCAVTISIPFTLFEIFFTPFQKNNTLFLLLITWTAGLVISMIGAAFIKRR